MRLPPIVWCRGACGRRCSRRGCCACPRAHARRGRRDAHEARPRRRGGRDPPAGGRAAAAHDVHRARDNAYLALEGPEFLPPGIAMPRTARRRGRVQASAIVDLDAVRRSRERSLFDPLAYLTGAVEVVAAGSVEGSEGEGLIRYESATVGGVAVPKGSRRSCCGSIPDAGAAARLRVRRAVRLARRLRAVSVERGSVTVTQ